MVEEGIRVFSGAADCRRRGEGTAGAVEDDIPSRSGLRVSTPHRGVGKEALTRIVERDQCKFLFEVEVSRA